METTPNLFPTLQSEREEMEATQANVASGYVSHAVSIGLSNQLAETTAPVHPTTVPRVESYRGLLAAYPPNKRPCNPSDTQYQDSIKHPGSGCHPRRQAPAPPAGVSNCYVFKSRLQEYAQKVGLSTPTYETIREGPSHEPSFRSSVIVNGFRYDSLSGFFNRKAAEQSAAEVALMELSASGEKKETISTPVHETGLCKNVLQEYAQKMNYATPTYICKKDGSPGRSSLFSCTVDIGGIQYIGAAAKTKKEAEIKAARTALLAIQSSRNAEGEPSSKTNYTVVPCKRKVPGTAPPKGETSKPKKSKKPRLKNKRHKKMHPDGFSGNQVQVRSMVICVDNDLGTQVANQNVQVADNGQSIYCPESSAQVNGSKNLIAHIGDPSGEGHACQLTNSQQEVDVNTGLGDSDALSTDANRYNGSTDITPVVNAPILSQLGALLPDDGVVQGREAPTMTFVNNEKAGNDDHVVGNIAPLINTRASEQLDVVNLGSGIGSGDPADGPMDAKALLPGVGPVDHVVAANATPLREEIKTGTSETKVQEMSAAISCSDQTVKDPDANA